MKSYKNSCHNLSKLTVTGEDDILSEIHHGIVIEGVDMKHPWRSWKHSCSVNENRKSERGYSHCW